jgi:hypothetical protein
MRDLRGHRRACGRHARRHTNEVRDDLRVSSGRSSHRRRFRILPSVDRPLPMVTGGRRGKSTGGVRRRVVSRPQPGRLQRTNLAFRSEVRHHPGSDQSREDGSPDRASDVAAVTGFHPRKPLPPPRQPPPEPRYTAGERLQRVVEGQAPHDDSDIADYDREEDRLGRQGLTSPPFLHSSPVSLPRPTLHRSRGRRATR